MVKVGFILVPVHQASTLWLCPAAKFRQKYFNTGCKLAREPAATRPVQRKKERNHRNFFGGQGIGKLCCTLGIFYWSWEENMNMWRSSSAGRHDLTIDASEIVCVYMYVCVYI